MWPKYIDTYTHCTLRNEAFSSSSHIPELKHLAQNILRCFYTRSFWNCTVTLKNHTSSISSMARMCATSRNSIKAQYLYPLHNLAKSCCTFCPASVRKKMIRSRKAQEIHVDPYRKNQNEEGKMLAVDSFPVRRYYQLTLGLLPGSR